MSGVEREAEKYSNFDNVAIYQPSLSDDDEDVGGLENGDSNETYDQGQQAWQPWPAAAAAPPLASLSKKERRRLQRMSRGAVPMPAAPDPPPPPPPPAPVVAEDEWSAPKKKKGKKGKKGQSAASLPPPPPPPPPPAEEPEEEKQEKEGEEEETKAEEAEETAEEKPKGDLEEKADEKIEPENLPEDPPEDLPEESPKEALEEAPEEPPEENVESENKEEKSAEDPPVEVTKGDETQEEKADPKEKEPEVTVDTEETPDKEEDAGEDELTTPVSKAKSKKDKKKERREKEKKEREHREKEKEKERERREKERKEKEKEKEKEKKEKEKEKEKKKKDKKASKSSKSSKSKSSSDSKSAGEPAPPPPPPPPETPAEEESLENETPPDVDAPVDETNPTEELAPAAEDSSPAEEPKPSEEAPPAPAPEEEKADEAEPAPEDAPPAPEPKATDEAPPAEAEPPAEEEKAAESAPSAEDEKPPAGDNSAEEEKPAKNEEVAAVAETAPAEEKAAEESKPAEEKAPAEETPAENEKPAGDSEPPAVESPAAECLAADPPADEKPAPEEESADKETPAETAPASEQKAPEDPPTAPVEEEKPAAEDKSAEEEKSAQSPPANEAEEKPADAKLESVEETKPAEEEKPAETVDKASSDDTIGEESKPADVAEAEKEPAEVKAAEDEPTEGDEASTEEVAAAKESAPEAETKTPTEEATSKEGDAAVDDTTEAEAKPVQEKPADEKPAEEKPAQTTEVMSLEEKPADKALLLEKSDEEKPATVNVEEEVTEEATPKATDESTEAESPEIMSEPEKSAEPASEAAGEKAVEASQSLDAAAPVGDTPAESKEEVAEEKTPDVVEASEPDKTSTGESPPTDEAKDTVEADLAHEEPADEDSEAKDAPATEEAKSDVNDKTAEAEEKPAEEAPANSEKSAEAESKPAEVEDDSTKESAVEVKPTEDTLAEDKSAGEKPVEEKSEGPPATEEPAEEKPDEEKPVEEKPVEEKPAEIKPAEDVPTEKPTEVAAEEPEAVEKKDAGTETAVVAQVAKTEPAEVDTAVEQPPAEPAPDSTNEAKEEEKAEFKVDEEAPESPQAETENPGSGDDTPATKLEEPSDSKHEPESEKESTLVVALSQESNDAGEKLDSEPVVDKAVEAELPEGVSEKAEPPVAESAVDEASKAEDLIKLAESHDDTDSEVENVPPAPEPEPSLAKQDDDVSDSDSEADVELKSEAPAVADKKASGSKEVTAEESPKGPESASVEEAKAESAPDGSTNPAQDSDDDSDDDAANAKDDKTTEAAPEVAKSEPVTPKDQDPDSSDDENDDEVKTTEESSEPKQVRFAEETEEAVTPIAQDEGDPPAEKSITAVGDVEVPTDKLVSPAEAKPAAPEDPDSDSEDEDPQKTPNPAPAVAAPDDESDSDSDADNGDVGVAKEKTAEPAPEPAEVPPKEELAPEAETAKTSDEKPSEDKKELPDESDSDSDSEDEIEPAKEPTAVKEVPAATEETTEATPPVTSVPEIDDSESDSDSDFDAEDAPGPKTEPPAEKLPEPAKEEAAEKDALEPCPTDSKAEPPVSDEEITQAGGKDEKTANPGPEPEEEAPQVTTKDDPPSESDSESEAEDLPKDLPVAEDNAADSAKSEGTPETTKDPDVKPAEEVSGSTVTNDNPVDEAPPATTESDDKADIETEGALESTKDLRAKAGEEVLEPVHTDTQTTGEAPPAPAKTDDESPLASVDDEKPADDSPATDNKPAEEAPAAKEEAQPSAESSATEDKPAEEPKAAAPDPGEDKEPTEEAPVANETPVEEAPAADEDAKPAEEAPAADDKPADDTPMPEVVAKSTEETPPPAEETTPAPEDKIKPAEEAPAPGEDDKAAVEAPATDDKPADEDPPAPTDEAKPTNEAAVGETTSPADDSNPAEKALDTDESAAAEVAARGLSEAPAPGDDSKPADDASPPPAPEEEAKPEEAKTEPAEEAKPAEETPPAPEDEAKATEEKAPDLEAKAEEVDEAAKDKAKDEEESKDKLGPIPAEKKAKKGEDHHSFHDTPLDFQQHLGESNLELHEDSNYDGVMALHSNDTQEQQDTQTDEDQTALTTIVQHVTDPQATEVAEEDKKHDKSVQELPIAPSLGEETTDVASTATPETQEVDLAPGFGGSDSVSGEDTAGMVEDILLSDPGRDQTKVEDTGETFEAVMSKEEEETPAGDSLGGKETSRETGEPEEQQFQHNAALDDIVPAPAPPEVSPEAQQQDCQENDLGEELSRSLPPLERNEEEAQIIQEEQQSISDEMPCGISQEAPIATVNKDAPSDKKASEPTEAVVLEEQSKEQPKEQPEEEAKLEHKSLTKDSQKGQYQAIEQDDLVTPEEVESNEKRQIPLGDEAPCERIPIEPSEHAAPLAQTMAIEEQTGREENQATQKSRQAPGDSTPKEEIRAEAEEPNEAEEQGHDKAHKIDAPVQLAVVDLVEDLIISTHGIALVELDGVDEPADEATNKVSEQEIGGEVQQKASSAFIDDGETIKEPLTEEGQIEDQEPGDELPRKIDQEAHDFRKGSAESPQIEDVNTVKPTDVERTDGKLFDMHDAEDGSAKDQLATKQPNNELQTDQEPLIISLEEQPVDILISEVEQDKLVPDGAKVVDEQPIEKSNAPTEELTQPSAIQEAKEQPEVVQLGKIEAVEEPPLRDQVISEQQQEKELEGHKNLPIDETPVGERAIEEQQKEHQKSGGLEEESRLQDELQQEPPAAVVPYIDDEPVKEVKEEKGLDGGNVNVPIHPTAVSLDTELLAVDASADSPAVPKGTPATGAGQDESEPEEIVTVGGSIVPEMEIIESVTHKVFLKAPPDGLVGGTNAAIEESGDSPVLPVSSEALDEAEDVHDVGPTKLQPDDLADSTTQLPSTVDEEIPLPDVNSEEKPTQTEDADVLALTPENASLAVQTAVQELESQEESEGRTKIQNSLLTSEVVEELAQKPTEPGAKTSTSAVSSAKAYDDQVIQDDVPHVPIQVVEVVDDEIAQISASEITDPPAHGVKEDQDKPKSPTLESYSVMVESEPVLVTSSSDILSRDSEATETSSIVEKPPTQEFCANIEPTSSADDMKDEDPEPESEIAPLVVATREIEPPDDTVLAPTAQGRPVSDGLATEELAKNEQELDQMSPLAHIPQVADIIPVEREMDEPSKDLDMIPPLVITPTETIAAGMPLPPSLVDASFAEPSSLLSEATPKEQVVKLDVQHDDVQEVLAPAAKEATSKEPVDPQEPSPVPEEASLGVRAQPPVQETEPQSFHDLPDPHPQAVEPAGEPSDPLLPDQDIGETFSLDAKPSSGDLPFGSASPVTTARDAPLVEEPPSVHMEPAALSLPGPALDESPTGENLETRTAAKESIAASEPENLDVASRPASPVAIAKDIGKEELENQELPSAVPPVHIQGTAEELLEKPILEAQDAALETVEPRSLDIANETASCALESTPISALAELEATDQPDAKVLEVALEPPTETMLDLPSKETHSEDLTLVAGLALQKVDTNEASSPLTLGPGKEQDHPADNINHEDHTSLVEGEGAEDKTEIDLVIPDEPVLVGLQIDTSSLDNDSDVVLLDALDNMSEDEPEGEISLQIDDKQAQMEPEIHEPAAAHPEISIKTETDDDEKSAIGASESSQPQEGVIQSNLASQFTEKAMSLDEAPAIEGSEATRELNLKEERPTAAEEKSQQPSPDFDDLKPATEPLIRKSSPQPDGPSEIEVGNAIMSLPAGGLSHQDCSPGEPARLTLENTKSDEAEKETASSLPTEADQTTRDVPSVADDTIKLDEDSSGQETLVPAEPVDLKPGQDQTDGEFTLTVVAQPEEIERRSPRASRSPSFLSEKSHHEPLISGVDDQERPTPVHEPECSSVMDKTDSGPQQDELPVSNRAELLSSHESLALAPVPATQLPSASDTECLITERSMPQASELERTEARPDSPTISVDAGELEIESSETTPIDKSDDAVNAIDAPQVVSSAVLDSAEIESEPDRIENAAPGLLEAEGNALEITSSQLETEPSEHAETQAVDPTLPTSEVVKPKPEVIQPDVIESEVIETESSKTEDITSVEPETSEPGVETVVSKPEAEVVELGPSQLEVAEPEASKPETPKSEVAETEVIELAAPKLDAVEAEVVKPESLEPEVIEPVTETEVVEAVAVKADPKLLEAEGTEAKTIEEEAAEANIAKPEVIEPDSSKSVVTETEAAGVDQQFTQPTVTGPDSSKPEDVEIEAQAISAEPLTLTLELVDTEVSIPKLEVIEPDTSKPEGTVAEATETEVVERAVADPEVSEGDFTQAEASNFEVEVDESEVDEPDTSKPTVASLAVDETVVIERELTELEVAEPNAPNEEAIETTAVEPDTSEPAAAKPVVVEPKATEPDAFEVDPTETGVIESDASTQAATDAEISKLKVVPPVMMPEIFQSLAEEPEETRGDTEAEAEAKAAPAIHTQSDALTTQGNDGPVDQSDKEPATSELDEEELRIVQLGDIEPKETKSTIDAASLLSPESKPSGSRDILPETKKVEVVESESDHVRSDKVEPVGNSVTDVEPTEQHELSRSVPVEVFRPRLRDSLQEDLSPTATELSPIVEEAVEVRLQAIRPITIEPQLLGLGLMLTEPNPVEPERVDSKSAESEPEESERVEASSPPLEPAGLGFDKDVEIMSEPESIRPIEPEPEPVKSLEPAPLEAVEPMSVKPGEELPKPLSRELAESVPIELVKSTEPLQVESVEHTGRELAEIDSLQTAEPERVPAIESEPLGPELVEPELAESTAREPTEVGPQEMTGPQRAQALESESIELKPTELVTDTELESAEMGTRELSKSDSLQMVEHFDLEPVKHDSAKLELSESVKPEPEPLERGPQEHTHLELTQVVQSDPVESQGVESETLDLGPTKPDSVDSKAVGPEELELTKPMTIELRPRTSDLVAIESEAIESGPSKPTPQDHAKLGLHQPSESESIQSEAVLPEATRTTASEIAKLNTEFEEAELELLKAAIFVPEAIEHAPVGPVVIESELVKPVEPKLAEVIESKLPASELVKRGSTKSISLEPVQSFARESRPATPELTRPEPGLLEAGDIAASQREEAELWSPKSEDAFEILQPVRFGDGDLNTRPFESERGVVAQSVDPGFQETKATDNSAKDLAKEGAKSGRSMADSDLYEADFFSPLPAVSSDYSPLELVGAVSATVHSDKEVEDVNTQEMPELKDGQLGLFHVAESTETVLFVPESPQIVSKDSEPPRETVTAEIRDSYVERVQKSVPIREPEHTEEQPQQEEQLLLQTQRTETQAALRGIPKDLNDSASPVDTTDRKKPTSVNSEEGERIVPLPIVPVKRTPSKRRGRDAAMAERAERAEQASDQSPVQGSPVQGSPKHPVGDSTLRQKDLAAGVIGAAAVSGIAASLGVKREKSTGQSPRSRSYQSQPAPHPPVSYKPHRVRRASRSQERGLPQPVKRPTETDAPARDRALASAPRPIETRRFKPRFAVEEEGESSRAAAARHELRHPVTTIDQELRRSDFYQPVPASPVELPPRPPTPDVVVPNAEMISMHRSRTLRRKHKMLIQRAEDTVAAAVVIYATAEALSPTTSPPPASPSPFDPPFANPHGERGFFDHDNQMMNSEDLHSPVAPMSWRSFEDDEDEELRKSVADLFTDDKSRESGSSRDKDRHRRRRHSHSHHSSRSRGEEDRKDRRPREDDDRRTRRPRGDDEERRHRTRDEEGRYRSSRTDEERRRRGSRTDLEPRHRSSRGDRGDREGSRGDLSRGDEEPRIRGSRGEEEVRERRRRPSHGAADSHHYRRHRPDTAGSGTPGSGTPPRTPKRRDSGFSAESSGSSGKRHRTDEERAAHERRKAERAERAERREAREKEPQPAPEPAPEPAPVREPLPKERRERKGKEPEVARERSRRRRRHSHSTRHRPDDLRERPEDREETSRPGKKFFDVKHSAGVLAGNGTPPPLEDSAPPSPAKERERTREPVREREAPRAEPLKRSGTTRSTFARIRQSLDESRPKIRTRETEPEPRESRSKSKSSRPPTEDAARKARHQERRRAKEDDKKPGGIKAAFKKLFKGGS